MFTCWRNFSGMLWLSSYSGCALLVPLAILDLIPVRSPLFGPLAAAVVSYVLLMNVWDSGSVLGVFLFLLLSATIISAATPSVRIVATTPAIMGMLDFLRLLFPGSGLASIEAFGVVVSTVVVVVLVVVVMSSWVLDEVFVVVLIVVVTPFSVDEVVVVVVGLGVVLEV